MTRLEKIKQLADEYDKKQIEDKVTNTRLKALVEKHGIEDVSAASGLAMSSVVQYVTKADSYLVSWKALIKAETILSQI